MYILSSIIAFIFNFCIAYGLGIIAKHFGLFKEIENYLLLHFMLLTIRYSYSIYEYRFVLDKIPQKIVDDIVNNEMGEKNNG